MVLAHRVRHVEPAFAFLAERQYYVGHSYNSLQIVAGLFPIERTCYTTSCRPSCGSSCDPCCGPNLVDVICAPFSKANQKVHAVGTRAHDLLVELNPFACGSGCSPCCSPCMSACDSCCSDGFVIGDCQMPCSPCGVMPGPNVWGGQPACNSGVWSPAGYAQAPYMGPPQGYGPMYGQMPPQQPPCNCRPGQGGAPHPAYGHLLGRI